ncbi:unnamed protein product [Vicia faba]|uniref:Replication factor A C-terminal domain-containing protein n=1 Tax=Vicia faba TaxID=3906 RepID=A0AAV0ZYW9_VICFA|nr:unnamed protein product [Vicia faba]
MASVRNDFVKEINPSKESWDIVVGVTKFKLQLEKLCCLDLKIRYNGTVVTDVGTGQITMSPYSIIYFPEIVGKIDMDYLIDVVGILAGVGRERVYERNRVTTKYKVIELESNSMKLESTLFGLLFNPNISKANSFKLNDNIGSPTQPFSYMKDSSDLSLKEEFLNLCQCKTIEELKESQNDMVCMVLGTIKHVIGGNDWWYVTCVCGKGVVADSKRFFCPKCNKHVWSIVPRYRVKLRVVDETDSATSVLFIVIVVC